MGSPNSDGGGGESWGGTAEEARVRVRLYFDQLKEVLQQQESVALRALDTHIRERICSIRQQQEDIASLLSQMVSVVMDGERVMQQDDGRLVLAS
ncbi:UNVERIFIED_CONTAM: hypothetical protein GTU68_037851, partial [Idotea baltica]|nr:hypothetical protein [Idotea baltica]